MNPKKCERRKKAFPRRFTKVNVISKLLVYMVGYKPFILTNAVLTMFFLRNGTVFLFP